MDSKIHCLFSIKRIVFIWFFISYCHLLFSQQLGMGTKLFNFSTFSENKKVSCPLLDKRSSDKAKKHPEYGILPFNAKCKECVELLDKRTEHSRLFIDTYHGTNTWSQQSYFPLHYTDNNGFLRTIDHRLRPSPGHPGVYAAPDQPVPVRFDLATGYTSLDLHSFELIYNKGLKMYFVEDTNAASIAITSADYRHYTVGDDGARVFNIWQGIDMEAFAKEGKIETNFIIASKPVMPVSKGYMVIEDHVTLPEGYTLERSDGSDGRSRLDLLVKNKQGAEIARLQHVSIRNAANWGLTTEYVVQRQANDYIIKMLVPYSFLNTDASDYPIVVDPIVSGSVDTGNYHSTGLPSANLCFSTNPAHCDYHMTDTVPGMSTLVSAVAEIEDVTTIIGQTANGRGCQDTVLSDHGAFAHVCLMREIWHILVSDQCNAAGKIDCFYTTNCDTPGTVTSDPSHGVGAGPITIPFNPYISCIPPQCPDFLIPWTLENFDSICEDNCGNLCAIGNKWEMTIEACTIDAYLTTTDSNVCAGQSTTVTCHPSCGVPPYHYVWSTGDTTQTITVFPPAVGIDVQCTAYDACNNPVQNPPDQVINQIQSPLPSADAGPGGIVCEGGTVTLGGNPTATGSNTTTWTASPAQALSWLSSTIAANPTVTVPEGITDTSFYVVTVSDGTCTRLDTAFVYSLPNPVAAIDTNGSTKICNGQSVTLNANGPFSSYLWNTGSTSQSITVSTPGSYYVIVTDANNCKDTSSSVAISQIQVPNIHVYPDTTIFYGQSVELYTDISLSPPAVDSFFWSPNDSTISCLKCTNPTVAPLDQESYYLTVYTQGCVLSDSTLISVILPDKFYIPNAFTPNGDGINDNFFLYGQSGVTVHSFKVFDRWGEKVYDGLFPWDGTYKGQKCPPGVYVYIFSVGLFGQLQDEVRRGSVTLIR
jgi:gliding motility-associated-like protein